MMTQATTQWGDRIAVEEIRGVPFRMYTDRPRRVDSLLGFAERWGSRPHIVQGQRVATFTELQQASLVKAAQLAELEVGRGDHVLILGFNSPDWVANFWASLLAGGVPVLANAWWSEAELSEALNALRPAITVADKRGASRLPAGCRTGPWEAPWGSEAASLPRSDLTEGSENDAAVIIFTSGTSGRAKPVVLSHRALLAGLQMLLHVSKRLPHQLDGAPRDIGLHTGPLFHMGGIQSLLRSVVIGGTLVMPAQRFDPGEALELIERWKVTRWSAVPTMATRLLEHPDVHRRDLRSLRSLTLGGAPVYPELVQQIRTGLPGIEARVTTGYGLTENGGQATAASHIETTERPGSSGRALPCVDLTILPRPGLPDGEILIRSSTQMTGYFGETDDSPIDAGGWLHTGDLGRVDDEGYLFITGRSKDLIIRGGENIAPAAVERALVAVPGVAEAVVFGIPHAVLGEEVAAVVVVEGDLTLEKIKAGLRSLLASFATPSRWWLRTEPLPVNHTGKIDKPAVVAGIQAELAKEADPDATASREPGLRRADRFGEVQ